MSTEPRIEYQRRLDQRQKTAAKFSSLHHQIGNARLIVFLGGAAIAWFSLKAGSISPWWLLLPIFLFTGLAAWHSRVLQSLQQCGRAIDFYERGLARIDEKWEGAGEPGDRFKNPAHPYAEDLDLFGQGSLFELLCCARTHAGEDMLAAWLKAPAEAEMIRARQEAVEELRSALDLREDLAGLGTDMRTGVHPEPLIKWGEEPPRFRSNTPRIMAAILTFLVLLSIGPWIFSGIHQWFMLGILAQLLFVFAYRKKIGPAVQVAENAGRDLSLLSAILARLEKESFHTPYLKMLRTRLDCDGKTPSILIGRLNRLIVLLDSRRNMLFAPIALVLMWELQLAYLVEDWRRRHGHSVSNWLETVAELEALSSLAGYSYEHPRDPFPEITSDAPCFEGKGLGHPLIPENRCIRNDILLSGETRIFLVSGSNMSGKSTLLRTVGINAVLALAGAPVRADHLRISPLAVGASIRVMDSLHSGTSRFYAEITRLRQLVSISDGPIPLLFLLDELLHGTNSHDRRIGAEAIIKGLARKGSIGLFTTHDLALSHIAEVLAPHAINVHFEDHIEKGRMVFDYHLLPGIVKKSNALELMRSIGLEV